MSRALKDALVPLATSAHLAGASLSCDVTPDVGEFVLGERRALAALVARATLPAVSAARQGEVCVRLTRQRAGFDLTDRILVSVTTRREAGIEDGDAVEAVLPMAHASEERAVAPELAGVRMLLVVAGLRLGSMQRVAMRRFGADVESVADAHQAEDLVRAAAASHQPFDVVFVDDHGLDTGAILRVLAVDGMLASTRTIVATALAAGPARDAYAVAGAALTLSQPVLATELRDAIVHLRELAVLTVPSVPAPESAVVARTVRRESGTRSVRLAEVLASLAVGPSRSNP
jgi:hypothetical protein